MKLRGMLAALLSAGALVAATPGAAHADTDSVYWWGSDPGADITYHVTVRTADVQDAGTNADLDLRIETERGTVNVPIDNDPSTLEQGAVEEYTFTAPELGAVRGVSGFIDCWYDESASPNWLLDSVTVETPSATITVRNPENMRGAGSEPVWLKDSVFFTLGV